MGREYSRIKLTIWNDPDFQALTYRAQWLYFVMLTHPTIDACGVVEWREAKLTHFADGMTVRDLRSAAAELGRGRFIAVDPDTEEALIRSFVRHDGGMKSPNMVKGIVRAHAGIASRKLKAIVSEEVRRACEEHPEWDSVALAQPVTKQFQGVQIDVSEFVPDWFATESNQNRKGFDSDSDRSESDSNGFDSDSDLIPLQEGNPFDSDSDPRTHNPEPSTYVERRASSADAEEPTPQKRTSEKRGTRLPDDWEPSPDLIDWTRRECPEIDIRETLDGFRDYWKSAPGAKGRKADWDATWRNWARKNASDARQRAQRRSPSPPSSTSDRMRGWLQAGQQLINQTSSDQGQLPMIGGPR